MILKEPNTQETILQQIRSIFDITPAQYPDSNARWLLKEKENIRGLVEIVASELVDHLDFNGIKEHNRSYISDTLKTLESDMVFSVPFKTEVGTDELLIYILIEHQSTVDPMMPFRVLYYMCQIWDEQRRELEASDVPKSEWRLRPILPIVYYTGTQRWQTPIALSAIMDVPTLLERFVPNFDTLFLGVKDTDPTELTKSDNPFGWLLKVLQQEDADEQTIRDAMREVLEHIGSLDTISASQQNSIILCLYQMILFRRPDMERPDLLAFVDANTQDEEIKNMVMTGAEALIQQGVEQGMKENAIDNILLVLDTRFQADTAQILRPRLESIDDIQVLNQLVRVAAETQSLDAFINDIALPD